MSKTMRWFFYSGFLGILLSMSIGCAGRQSLLKENEKLISEKAWLEEEIDKNTQKCERQKTALNQQLAARTGECQQIRGPLEKEIKELRSKINQILQEKKLAVDEVTIQNEKKKLIVSLSDQILFDRGSFAIKESMKPVLKVLAEHIRKYPDRLILVEGHTCNLPIHGEKFPTNWELSTRRSTEVLRYFIEEEKLSPQQFSAMGYGEYHPQFPNTTKEGRMKNRRVEIVILSPEMTHQLIN